MSRLFLPGDPAPDFTVRSNVNPHFHFNSVAGRYVMLCFLGSAADAERLQTARELFDRHRSFFNDEHACLFIISIDPADEATARLQPHLPGLRIFWDFDGAVSRLYGALPQEAPTDPTHYQPFTLILDPMLRILAALSMQDLPRYRDTLSGFLHRLPPCEQHATVPLHAPALIVPRIFEPDFCAMLIDLYERHGGEESGFMRERDGKTVGIHDHNFKRRRDYTIADPALNARIRQAFTRRLLPEVKKAFQFQVTRMERYIVARYDSETGGFFRPHRDNTTSGTAHRRFACTLNLNTGSYDGGGLRFPEFGMRSYTAPLGGAIVFSCSLLHEALPVTRGQRYAFLPFLYDEAAAELRARNLDRVTGEVYDLNNRDHSL